MPGVIGNPAKRKRESSEKRATKRARSESSDDIQTRRDAILLLGDEIFKSKKNYNNIVCLIKILGSENDDSAAAAISLCRVFAKLMLSGDMVKKPGSTEKEAVVIRWLKERYSEYKSALIVLLGREDVGSTAMTLCMTLLKKEGQYLRNGEEYCFPVVFLTTIIQALLNPESHESVRREFGTKYVEEYDDIRFYTFKAIE